MLEELLQQFADALEVERRSNWLQGDIVARAVMEHGKGVLGKFAEVGRCTIERIRQLARIATAFPPEVRHPDVSWTWYRAVYQAAKRLGEEPLVLLEEALAHEWSQADLAALGRKKETPARFTGRCDWCGVRVVVETDANGIGRVVHCPLCEERRALGVLVSADSHHR